MNRYRTPGRLAAAVLFASGLALAAACSGSVTDALLTATDPDIINPTDVNSKDGAEGLRLGVNRRLITLTGEPVANAEGVWFMGGLLTDEWKSGDTFVQRDETDKRTIALDNSIVTAGYRYIHRTRIAANIAIDALRKFPPDSVKPRTAYVAQMQWIRGYAALLSAENFCNGQPFSDGSTGVIVEGPPVSVAQAFQKAIVDADSAIGTVGAAADTLNTRQLLAARLVKAFKLAADDRNLLTHSNVQEFIEGPPVRMIVLKTVIDGDELRIERGEWTEEQIFGLALAKDLNKLSHGLWTISHEVLREDFLDTLRMV